MREGIFIFNITFQQIEAFLTIAKYLNISKAGEVLYTSQPSLSKTLKRFEEGVGMHLFTRSNQGMALTEEGKYLYSALEPLYETMVKSIRNAQQRVAASTKSLRIVEPSSYDFAEDFNPLKSLVKEYERLYPDVVIHEMLCDFRELRHALQFGNIDLVFSQDFGIRDIQNISQKHISKFKRSIAIAKSHPLAQKETLDISALSNEVFYAVHNMEDQQADRKAIMGVCQLEGFTPRSIEIVPNFQTLLHMIKLRKGISICGRFINTGIDDEIKYYPAPRQKDSYVVVAWRTGKLTREARNFINLIPDIDEVK